MSKRESHKQALRQLLDRYNAELRLGPGAYVILDREALLAKILRINERFNDDPGLDEALNSGDGTYKP